MDGPVSKAVRKALEEGNVNLILPWAPELAEPELKTAFERALRARELGGEAREVADLWLLETAVRLHREGEGAAYTGLKPAGLDWGPVGPRAESSIWHGDPSATIDFLMATLDRELRERFEEVMSRKGFDVNDVVSARRSVQAELGFVLFSHGIFAKITGLREHGEERSPSPVHSH